MQGSVVVNGHVVAGRIREADDEGVYGRTFPRIASEQPELAAARSKTYTCYTEIGALSRPDLLFILSTPTIFPMMPDRVETLILTMTR